MKLNVCFSLLLISMSQLRQAYFLPKRVERLQQPSLLRPQIPLQLLRHQIMVLAQDQRPGLRLGDHPAHLRWSAAPGASMRSCRVLLSRFRAAIFFCCSLSGLATASSSASLLLRLLHQPTRFGALVVRAELLEHDLQLQLELLLLQRALAASGSPPRRS